jgi:hypothetical protein
MSQDPKNLEGLSVTGEATDASTLHQIFAMGREAMEKGSTVSDSVEVSPEMAVALIRMFSVNYLRARLRGESVATYASAMMDGTYESAMMDRNWGDSGGAIPITRDGYVLNGLNRMMAIVVSGTAQKLPLVIMNTTRDEELEPFGMPEFHAGHRFCDIEFDSEAKIRNI